MTSDQRAAGPRAPSAWNLPNYLTVFRFALVPVFGWLLLAEGGHVWGYRLAAFAVFGVAMVTDSIDGDLARRRKQVTDFGKVADPIADKAMLGMALIGLSIIGIVPWWVTVVILVREVGRHRDAVRRDPARGDAGGPRRQARRRRCRPWPSGR